MTEEVNNCGILCFTDTSMENKSRNETGWYAAVCIPPLAVLVHLPSPLKVWLITLRSDLEQGTSSRVASAAEPPALGLITSLLLCTDTELNCVLIDQDITRTCEPAKTNAYTCSTWVSRSPSRTHTRARALGTYENRIIKAHHQLYSPGTHPHAHWNPCRIMLLKCARATRWYRGARGFWFLHWI